MYNKNKHLAEKKYMDHAPTLKDIEAAYKRIEPYIHRTHVMQSQLLNHMSGGVKLYFKCENFQKSGSFKARGACNAVLSLSDEDAKKGVTTHSSGNHAAALAMAASLRKIPAYIVMPKNATKIKQNAVKGYGAEVTLCEPTQTARENTMEDIHQKTGAMIIHPYDNYDVIAGQGTVALEFLQAIPELEMIIVPIGGGGLISGIAIAAKSIKPNIKIIGVEPELANDAYKSFKVGHRIIEKNLKHTIADGLKMSIGERNFPIVQQYVDDIVTVSETSIANAMRKIWEVMKIVVEPSGAVPYAAVLEQKIQLPKRVGIVLTGGNVDLEHLPWQELLS